MAISLFDSSPGVFIREIDNTLFSTPRNSSIIYLSVFSKQGPTNEPISINSVSEFEQVFGIPETAAERYGYHAASEILNTSGGVLYVTRLPYGKGCGFDTANQYSALVYPIIAVSATEISPCTYYTSLSTNALLTAAAVNFPELLNYVSVADYLESYTPKCDFQFTTDTTTTLSALEITHSKTCTGYFDTLLLKNQTITKAQLTAAGALFYTNVNSNPASALNVTSDETGTLITFNPALSTNGGSNYLRLSATNFASTGIQSVGININNTLGYDLTSTLQNNLWADQNYAVPVELHFQPSSGCFFDCPMVSALGLTVPESARWKFDVLDGAAQLNDGNFYVYGEPIHRLISDQEYELFKNGQFDWKCGAIANANAEFDINGNNIQAGMVIVNELKTVNDQDFSGFYVAVNDNYNVNPSTDFNNITAIAGKYSASECVGVTGTWTHVDDTRLNFDVHQPFNGNPGSLAEIIENAGTGDFSKPQNKASVVVSLFKLRPSLLGDDALKLDQLMVEKFTGSMDADAKLSDSYGGAPRSNFIEKTVNQGSNYLKMYVNPYLSENNCWNGSDGKPQKYVRMLRKSTQNIIAGYSPGDSLKGYADKLHAIGVDQSTCVDKALAICKRKDIGYLPCKLERALKLLDYGNIEIDLTLDSGLSTIWATRNAVAGNPCNANGGDVDLCYHYDDTVFVDTSSLMPFENDPISSPLQDGWEEIYNVFNSYILGKLNSDGIAHFHVQDPLRQIFVNGKDYKISKRQKSVQLDKDGNVSDRFATFSRNIVTPLKNLSQAVNSSYVGMYANWMKGYIPVNDKEMWLPSSNYIVPALARIDRAFWPWYALLGVENGTLPNVLDLAVNPSNQRERDFLYRFNYNPIYLDSTYGVLVFGQKTMLKAEKDTNRINVRRGLLWLEKNIKKTLIPFIGQPNTLVTRNRIKNALQPLIDTMKNNYGINDGLAICDQRNNDGSSNCIKVNVLVQVTKTTEFIDAVVQVERNGVNLTQAFLF
jgi:hypothetical protein